MAFASIVDQKLGGLRLAAAAGLLIAGAGWAAANEAAQTETAAAEVSAEMLDAGGALYMENCRFCHGSKGTAGQRLSGNERVADAAYIAGTILSGPGYMTPFRDHLSDDEVALIATFVRNSWGNAYGVVTSEDVAPLR